MKIRDERQDAEHPVPVPPRHFDGMVRLQSHPGCRRDGNRDGHKQVQGREWLHTLEQFGVRWNSGTDGTDGVDRSDRSDGHDGCGQHGYRTNRTDRTYGTNRSHGVDGTDGLYGSHGSHGRYRIHGSCIHRHRSYGSHGSSWHRWSSRWNGSYGRHRPDWSYRIGR
jgi:hypothetical protein